MQVICVLLCCDLLSCRAEGYIPIQFSDCYLSIFSRALKMFLPISLPSSSGITYWHFVRKKRLFFLPEWQHLGNFLRQLFFLPSFLRRGWKVYWIREGDSAFRGPFCAGASLQGCHISNLNSEISVLKNELISCFWGIVLSIFWRKLSCISHLATLHIHPSMWNGHHRLLL